MTGNFPTPESFSNQLTYQNYMNNEVKAKKRKISQTLCVPHRKAAVHPTACFLFSFLNEQHAELSANTTAPLGLENSNITSSTKRK